MDSFRPDQEFIKLKNGFNRFIEQFRSKDLQDNKQSRDLRLFQGNKILDSDKHFQDILFHINAFKNYLIQKEDCFNYYLADDSP